MVKRKADSIVDELPKKKVADATPLPSFLSGSDDAVTMLPRGKTSADSIPKTQAPRVQSEEQGLFTMQRAKKAKVVEANSDNEEEMKDDENVIALKQGLKAAALDKDLKNVYQLRIKGLGVGNVLLGCVKAMTELDMVISLPDGLTGFVSLREVSDAMANLVDAYINESEKAMSDNSTLSLPVLADMYKIGDLVRVVIVNMTSKDDRGKRADTRIELSMRPTLINTHITVEQLKKMNVLTTAVQSVQSKGYILETGITGVTAFLPKSDVKQQVLQVGYTMDVQLTATPSKESRVLNVTKNVLNDKAVLSISNDISLNSLKPGTLVQTTIMNHLVDGLQVRLLGDMMGTVSIAHLMKPMLTPVYNLESLYEFGKPYVARVLFVNPGTKQILLSYREDIVKNNQGCVYSDYNVSVGDVLKSVPILRTVGDHAVVLQLNSVLPNCTTKTPILAYLPRHECDDKPVETLPKGIKAGRTLDIRVTGMNAMEGFIVVTAKPSVVKSNVYQLSDIVVGKLYNVTVVDVKDKIGVFVSLTSTISGLVPLSHLRDTAVGTNNKLSEKYTVGKELKLRALSVDLDKQQVSFTAKPMLLKDDVVVVSSIEQVEKSLLNNQPVIAEATVVEANDRFVNVAFFNNVRGSCHISDMLNSGIIVEGQKPSDAYQAGQTVRVKVLKIKEKSLSVSFNVDKTGGKKNIAPAVPIGSWVSAQVISADAVKKVLNVEISYNEKKYDAILPISNISNIPTNASLLFDHYATTKPLLPLALVYNKQSEKLNITIQPLQLAFAANMDCTEFLQSISSSSIYEFNNQFVKALAKNGAKVNNLASSIISSSQNVNVNDFYLLNVTNIYDYGVYARGLGGVNVLLTKAELSDGFVEDVNNVVKIGETVGVLITKKIVNDDVAEGSNASVRLEGSMKPSVVNKFISSYDKLYTLIALAEQRFIYETIGVVNESKQAYVSPSVPIGTIFIDTQVTLVQGNAITLKSKSNSTAVINVTNPYHITGSSIKDGAVKGANVTSRVVYNNPMNGNSIVSCKPSIIDDILSSLKQRKEYAGMACASNSMGITCGSSVNVEVLHVDGNNVVVGLVDYKYTLAYTLARSININSSFTALLVPGYRLKATVLSNAANINTPLMVKLDFNVTKSSRVTLPDGTFYTAESLNDFEVGKVIKVKVDKYDEQKHQYPVSFGPASAYSDIVKGVISLSSIIDVDMSIYKKKKIPELSVFSEIDKLVAEDNVIDAKIIRKVVTNTEITLPGTKRIVKQVLYYVSIRPSDLEGDNYVQRYNTEEYSEDSTQIGTVISVSPSNIVCEFAPNMTTIIRPSAITTNEEYLNNLDNYIKVGDITRVKVKYNSTLAAKDADEAEEEETTYTKSKKYVASALIHTKLNAKGVDSNTNYTVATTAVTAVIGGIVENATVIRYDVNYGEYVVSLRGVGIAKLSFAELNDIFPTKTNIFNVGDVIPRVAIIGKLENNVYIVSSRDSRLELAEQGQLDVPTGVYNRKGKQESSTVEIFDPLHVSNVLTFKTVAVGQLLRGYIANITKYGVFVQLSGLLVGRVLLKNLGDSFISNAETKYKVGQLLSVRVMEVDSEKAIIDLAAKPSLVSSTNMRVLETLQPGMVIKGTVHNVNDSGVFISLKNCDLRALCRKNQCVDNKSVDYRSHYTRGDKVKAVVLNVDKIQQRIAVGLRASLFTKLNEIKSGTADAVINDKTSSNKDEEFLSKVFDSDDDDEEEDVNTSDDESDDNDETVITPVQARNAVVEAQIESAPSLFSSLVFNNTANTASKDDEEEELVPMFDDDDDWLQQSKQRKEAEIERAERAIMDENVPQSTEDFEMQCVRTPNNSYIWVQYMAFELTQGNISKAREIADKALKAISVHSSQERWNIWSALLSLENVYGTETSMGDTVKRAQKLNNPLTVQLELARIYELSSKIEKANDTYSTASKKYGSDISAHAIDIWTKWFTLLFTNNRVDDARKVLASAIQKLNVKQHPTVIIKFAQLEFHNVHGNADRARMLLEQFLTNNTKRLDVWIVFIDQELKLTRTLMAQVNGKPGDVKKAKNRVRALYDNITAEAFWKVWTTKQMKFIFKKYIDFEDEFGTASRVSTVQDRARLYVSSVTVE